MGRTGPGLRRVVVALVLLVAGQFQVLAQDILNPRAGDLLNPRGGDLLNPGARPAPSIQDVPPMPTRPPAPTAGWGPGWGDGPSLMLGPPPVNGRGPGAGAVGDAMVILDGSGHPIGSVRSGWSGRHILRDALGRPIGIIEPDDRRGPYGRDGARRDDTGRDRTDRDEARRERADRDGPTGYVVRDQNGRPIGRVEDWSDPTRRRDGRRDD
jgi:hypothetical protein